MKRLNNKGFAISTIIYSILIIAILIMAMLYGTLAFTKKTETDFVNNVEEELNTTKLPCKTSSSTYSVGTVITCDTESFYVIKNYRDKIDIISQKYLNTDDNQQKIEGTKIAFSTSRYWLVDPTGEVAFIKNIYGDSFPLNLPLDSNTKLYNPIKEYEFFLKNALNVTTAVATWPNKDDMTSLGCTTTTQTSYEWLKNSTFWLGSVDYDNEEHKVFIISNGKLDYSNYDNNNVYIRVKVTIDKKEVSS